MIDFVSRFPSTLVRGKGTGCVFLLQRAKDLGSDLNIELAKDLGSDLNIEFEDPQQPRGQLKQQSDGVRSCDKAFAKKLRGQTGLIPNLASRRNWRDESGQAIFLSDGTESCPRKSIKRICEQVKELCCSCSLKSESQSVTLLARPFGCPPAQSELHLGRPGIR